MATISASAAAAGANSSNASTAPNAGTESGEVPPSMAGVASFIEQLRQSTSNQTGDSTMALDPSLGQPQSTNETIVAASTSAAPPKSPRGGFRAAKAKATGTSDATTGAVGEAANEGSSSTPSKGSRSRAASKRKADGAEDAGEQAEGGDVGEVTPRSSKRTRSGKA